MAWKEKNVVDQRIEFVNRNMSEEITFTDLCNEYGISRKTGYKWIDRFYSHGYTGLCDKSRKPLNSPEQISEDEVIKIIKLRLAHPSWGAKKIEELLKRASSFDYAPSVSSIKRILDKAGLIEKKRKVKVDTSSETLRNMIRPNNPNDVWTIDFKGWWFCNNNIKSNPLTLRDDNSRYLLAVRLVDNQRTSSVKEVLKEVFLEFGLPLVIRSDNGSPFASHNSVLGLSELSAWWLSLGILPDRIQPGKPYQNGGHERMHLDIKKEIQNSSYRDFNLLQEILLAWKDEFNNIRPHEALGMKTPSEVYEKSSRKYTGDIDELIYPSFMTVRKVDNNGFIKLNNAKIWLSHALKSNYLGLYEYEFDKYQVWLNKFMLGTLDKTLYKFYPQKDLKVLPIS